MDQLSNVLIMYCKDKAEINNEVVYAGLSALGQIANSIGEEDTTVSWRAIRMKTAPKIGAALIVRHISGDELVLQLDTSDQIYMGSYSNLMSEDEISLIIAFDLKTTRNGRVFRLLDSEKTAEIPLDEHGENVLDWTNQPDFDVDLDLVLTAEEHYLEDENTSSEDNNKTETLMVGDMESLTYQLDDEIDDKSDLN